MRPNTLPFLAVLGLCAAPAAAGPAVVKGIRIDAEQVVLSLSKPAGFRSRLEGPPAALVLTLDDAELSSRAKAVAGVSGLVRGVTTSQSVEGGVPRARITILLDTARNYSPVWHGNDLTVELQSVMLVKTTPAAAEPEPAAAAKPEPAKTAAPAAKAAPAKKAAAAGKGAPPAPGYWVQFASLPGEESAVKERGQLEGALGKLEIRRAQVAGKPVFRVLLGPYADRPAAKAALDKAAAQGKKGFVIRD